MRLIFFVLVFLLSGCVSTHMKQYLGSDIRVVVLDSGFPNAAFDLSDGSRAFQFRWGGGVFVAPSVTNVSGSVSDFSGHSWFSASSVTTGGGAFHSEGCLISYITSWDEDTESWIVYDVRYPSTMVC